MAGRVFHNVENLNPNRNLFNLSKSHYANYDFGYLYPVLCRMVIPGDTLKLGIESVTRLDSLVVPVGEKIDVCYYSFFVPIRLLDSMAEKGRFESVISGGLRGEETRDFTRLTELYTKYVANGGTAQKAFGFNTLSQHLGIVPASAVYSSSGAFDDSALSYLNRKIMAYPWFAYNRIYMDYFADENIESDKFENKTTGVFDNGDDFVHTNMELLHGNWTKDYFTSSLPFQQRGTAPSLPLSGSLPVEFSNFVNNPIVVASSSSLPSSNAHKTLYLKSGGAFSTQPQETSDGSTSFPSVTLSVSGSFLSPSSSGSVDIGQGVTFDVNFLRYAFQVQKFLERNARSGVRYTEFLKSHFGVAPSDGTLDRPIYCGGTRSSVVISEVLQTSATQGSDEEFLGDYAGHGLGAFNDNKVVDGYRVQEFGVFMVLMLIKPKASYYQGVPREWLYETRFDFPFPEFMHLSEQAIYEGELFTSPSQTEQQFDDIFGYQGRFDELRVSQDSVAGDLAGNLDYWHLGRKFANAPQLSQDFIKIDSYKDDLHRIFNVQGSEANPVYPFIVKTGFDFSALRPLPFIAEPGLVDHF